MHAGLNEFLRLMEDARQSWDAMPDHFGQRFFILDLERVPDLLQQVYSQEDPGQPRLLLNGTPHEAFADQGALWLEALPGSPLEALCLQLCREQHAGVAIQASDEHAALKHARHLLMVDDGSGGQSVLPFYRPDYWGAYALTQPQGLYGPWLSVGICLPTRLLGYTEDDCLVWSPTPSERVVDPSLRYFLSPQTLPAQRVLRWLYWLDSHHDVFGRYTPEQLPGVIDDLELLVDHGIYEGRWLMKLGPLLRRGPLAEQASVMSILQQPNEPFITVDLLRDLAPEAFR